MGLCLWSRSRSGLGYVCVCGFVLAVETGWVKAWFGLALLWAVVVGYGGGVVVGFGMILGGAFWLWDGFCGVDVVGLVLDVMWWSWCPWWWWWRGVGVMIF